LDDFQSAHLLLNLTKLSGQAGALAAAPFSAKQKGRQLVQLTPYKFTQVSS
jgi:hypothetical protein